MSSPSKYLVTLCLGLVALAMCAHSQCTISGASQTVFANVVSETTVCSDLQSGCMHPDPDYYATEGCSGANVTYNECCSGGGDYPQPANDNIVNCTITLNNPAFNNTNCPGLGSYSVNTEIDVEISYSPCSRYIGVVTLHCTSVRGSDDYSGDGPGSVVSTGSFSITYAAIPCGPCTGGSCDTILGCLCPPNMSGDNCQYRDATAGTATLGASVSVASVFALATVSALLL